MSSGNGQVRAIGPWGRRHYDKLLACGSLLALGVTLLVLALKIGALQDLQESFERRVRSFVPAHPTAAAEDIATYRKALAMLETPPRLSEWTNNLFVPEKRVWCVDCGRPIPYEAVTCWFCKAAQPAPREKPRNLDSDGDGIPDLAEVALGLDPNNPDDAREDWDGDGFSNLIEFLHKTDLRDPLDFPPPHLWLKVKSIEGEPFGLEFVGKMKTPDGSYKFAINEESAGRTHWVRIGDAVRGYRIVKYTENIVREEVRGTMQRVDKSVLVFQDAEKTIPVVMNERQPHTEWRAVLVFGLNGDEHKIKPGQTISIRTVQYTVGEIDNAMGSVVLLRKSDGERVRVERQSQIDAAPVPPAGILIPNPVPGSAPTDV